MNTRASLFLAFVVLVAGGIVYLLLGQGGREPTSRAAPAPAAAPAGDEGPRGELAQPAALDTAPAAPTAATRVAQGAQTSATPAATSWTVRVMRDGAPAPDVEVAWATDAALRALPNDGKGARDYVERVLLAGSSGTTNAAGEIVLPPLPAGSALAASDGPRVAYRRIDGDETPPIVLELVLDRSLQVRVVDAREKPVAGVAVLLDLMDGRVNQQWTESTKSDGLATFEHIGVGRPIGDGAAGTVSIVGTFDQPIEAPFRVAEWPETALVLVVPDTGSIVVEVVDEQGKPRTGLEHDVELVVEREQVAGAMLYNRPHQQATVEEGRARFATVGLGLALSASFDGRPDFAPAKAVFRGPTRSAEEVVERLVVGAPDAVVLFRVVDPSGAPVANTEVEANVQRKTGGSSITTGGFHLQTDGEGRTRMPLLDRWHEGTTITLQLTSVLATDGRSGELDLSREFPSGETDVGDVVLRAPDVIVAGKLVDVDGKPAVNVQVKIETHAEGVEGEALDWWPIQWDSSKADGSFTFPEGATASDLRLAVVPEDFVEPEPISFVRGERDVVIVLERGGAAAGSVVAPEGLSPTVFQIRRGADENENRAVRVEADGTFVARGLAPGAVDVSLWFAPENARLMEFPGVAVADGETTRDPRLQEIDCRDVLTALHVRVRRPDGQAADGGWVRVLRGESQEAGFLIESGEALVLGPRGPLDLEISVPGYRIERRFDVRADLEVVLQNAFRVRLELAREIELPAAPAQLQVRLSRMNGPGEVRPAQSLGLFRGAERTGWWNRFFGNDTNTFGASREVFAIVQEPGIYLVEFFVVVGDSSGGMMSTSLEASPDTVPLELDESDADKTFRVAPNAQGLANAFGK